MSEWPGVPLTVLLAAECDDDDLLAELLGAAATPITDGLGPLVPPRPLPTSLPPMPWPPLYRDALLVRVRAWVSYLEAREHACHSALED